MRSALSVSFALALVATFSSGALGQGLLVNESSDERIRLPRPWVRPTPQPAAGSYKIEAIDINATVKDQVAKVQVAQTFRNTGSQPMEVAFLFPLPDDGAIDQLTLLVDGKELAGELLPADKAREKYEAIVRQNQDPALLEWVGQGMFRTSVFPVPAGAERKVTLRYTQLCKRAGASSANSRLTSFAFPLSTAKYTAGPVGKLTVRVAIESQSPITNLYSPSHKLAIDRPSGTRAVVLHEEKDLVPASDFRLFFDTPVRNDAGDRQLGASLVTYRPDKNEPGYFLMLASPPVEVEESAPEPPSKTVLLVVDRSGSMSGAKIDQAKEAMRFVINRLRDGDTFNLVAYDTDVESFRPELQTASDETRAAALAFVDGLFAGGSTNIDGALNRALGMLADSSRPNYVVFLTDGLPTAGERREAAIVDNTKQANRVRARLFSFGVGYDVNSRLLDKLTRANFGVGEFVRPEDNIEAAVARLYNRIGTPVLIDVKLAVDVEGQSPGGDAVTSSTVSGVYPTGEFDLFAGDQVVLVGRYARPGSAKVALSGAVAGEERAFAFPAELTAESLDDTHAFIGRLWATRRVGEIIDQIDLSGKNQELVDELVSLATRHGIVTEYTSFLADETADHNAVASNRMRTAEEADSLSIVEGRSAFQRRNSKLALQRAAAPASAVQAQSSGDAFGGGGGFGGGVFAGRQADRAEANRGAALGNAFFYDAKIDTLRCASNIRQLGRKTFFQRGKRDAVVWCDSSVNAEQEKNAIAIERYSRQYFDLIAAHGKHVAQYLAVDEPVVVRLGDNVYRW